VDIGARQRESIAVTANFRLTHVTRIFQKGSFSRNTPIWHRQGSILPASIGAAGFGLRDESPINLQWLQRRSLSHRAMNAVASVRHRGFATSDGGPRKARAVSNPA
jgi:hypothetical protein